jgi:hypothetical protein
MLRGASLPLVCGALVSPFISGMNLTGIAAFPVLVGVSNTIATLNTRMQMMGHNYSSYRQLLMECNKEKLVRQGYGAQFTKYVILGSSISFFGGNPHAKR